MNKRNFKQIDLLRKRRQNYNLASPYFVETKKYIKKGIFSGFIIITLSLFLGIPFIFRIKFLENKKNKVKVFSNEYDLVENKLKEEKKQLNKIANFNNNIKDSILNISSSSALFQEIALIIPKAIQLVEFSSKDNVLDMKAKLSNYEYLDILNSFLLNLENSELFAFDEFDLKKIEFPQTESNNQNYLVDINTKISTNYREINDKYLAKLGAFGLLNRLNILKNIEAPYK